MTAPKKRIKGVHLHTAWGHGVKQIGKLKKATRTGEPQMEIQLDEKIARGVYTNAAQISHTQTEFLLDFLFLQAGRPQARIHTRLITDPKHAKRFARALSENLKKYEERFGRLIEPDSGSNA